MKKLVTVLFYLSTWLVWAQTSTVNLTSEKQYIRGFGGINHPEWAGDMTAAQRTTAFGNGTGEMGLTVLRIFINDDKTQWNKALATALRAQQLGATIFATPWNPPASMCETVTRNNRQEKRLKYDSYSAYAQHLIDFNNYMKNNGVSLYAMSFANEPDWGFDWTWYSIDEVYNFTKNIAGTLRVNGIKVITAESFSYNKTYYDKVLNDPAALANIDIIGCHLYGSDANSPVSVYNYPLADSKAPGKERWMTEHYTNSDANSSDLWPDANDVSYEIYRCMVEGQMSVYTWWYIRRQYGPMNENGTISKRGYCMAQYSKFIRPGYTRVDATKNPTSGVYISAYKKGDDVVVVAVNRSTSSQTITISVPGTKVTTWEKYVTSGSKSLAKEANINSGTGSFQITLDPQSTTSFVGTAPVVTNPAPVVSITAPANNTVYTQGDNVTLNATATIATGSITKVDFYNGTTLLGTDATSPYSYTWSTVPSGIYSITAVATDGTGNKTTSSIVTVKVVPAAVITPSGATTFCSGGNVVLTSGIGSGYTYQWKNGANTISGATSNSYTATQTGSYTVTVTSNSQTSTSAAVAVTVNALPTATITAQGNTTFCQGNGNVTLNANTGTGLTYQWFNGTNTIGTGSSSLSLYVSSGSFTVKVTDANGCAATSAPVVVTANPAPVAPAVTASVSYCQNAAASQLTATGTNLKWYTVSTAGTALTATPTPATGTVGTTNYYVSQTTTGCESARSLIAVTVNALPTAAITTTTATTFCTGGSVLLTASAGTSYVWKNGTTQVGTNQTYTATAAGSYTVEVTNANSCKTTSAATTVTVNALPTAVITTTTATAFCTGGSVVLTASSGASYKWMNGTTQVGTNQTYTATTAGSYTVEVTNAGSCKATSAATTVTVNALPTAVITTATATSFCTGGSVVLTASSGSSYKWLNGTTAIAGATAQTYTATAAGSYTVEVTNAGSCKTTSAATTVTVNALPTATITANGPTTFAQGGDVELTASAGSSYKWFNGTTQVGTAQTYVATAAGSYTVEVTNAGNCSVTSSATIVTIIGANQPSLITITSPISNATVQGSITITADVTDPDGTIVLVEYLDGNTVIGTSTSSPYSYDWNNPGTGDHIITVRVTDSNGGITTSAPVIVTSEPLTTGVQLSNTLNATIYPNPSNGAVYIETDVDLSDAGFILIDVLGREVVISSTATGTGAMIDVSNLSEGTYVMVIKQDNSILRKKISVVK